MTFFVTFCVFQTVCNHFDITCNMYLFTYNYNYADQLALEIVE